MNEAVQVGVLIPSIGLLLFSGYVAVRFLAMAAGELRGGGA